MASKRGYRSGLLAEEADHEEQFAALVMTSEGFEAQLCMPGFQFSCSSKWEALRNIRRVALTEDEDQQLPERCAAQ